MLTIDKKEQHFQRLVKCLSFRGIVENEIDNLLNDFQLVEIKKGQHIIEMGAPNDGFFVLASGSAEIWRRNLFDDGLTMTETLETGACIGYESLISGKPNSKTVTMKTDGQLFAISKETFLTHIGSRVVQSISAESALDLMAQGYNLLDVRYEEEFEEMRIPNATLLPLHEISQRIHELDKSKRYIVYCHSGNRSQMALLKLALHNIEAVSLDGGIMHWPFDIQDDQAAA